MHNSTQSSVTEEGCQWCEDHSRNFTSTEKQTQTHDETTSTAQSNVQSHRHELLSSIPPTSPHKTLCKLNYSQLNLLLPPTWLTLTLCPTTQHRRLADWSRDRQAGAAHVTSVTNAKALDSVNFLCVTLWPWPETFWPWTAVVHGESRD